MDSPPGSDITELVDFRRRVAEIYQTVRSMGSRPEAWQHWRNARRQLFATHSQSPIEPDTDFTDLPYFPHDPSWRVIAEMEPLEADAVDVSHSGAGSTGFRPVGVVRPLLLGGRVELTVYWLEAYGGGLFLPFRDATSGTSTYGGGRYLLDTVKGADLGQEGKALVLDFNFAYHPSCVHSYRWSCPLSPPANHLTVPIEAGERLG